MATNVLAGIVTDRKATLYYNAAALGASVTTEIRAAVSNDPRTTADIMGRSARGKLIPRVFCKKTLGSSANFAVKIQHANEIVGVAESSWDWEDLATFTALTTDVATFESVELTKPVRPFLRVVITRTGGTVTALLVGYEYAQCGPRATVGAFKGTLE